MKAKPLSSADLEPLRKIAAARLIARETADEFVFQDEPYREAGDDPAWFDEVRLRIAENFPRDPDGRLTLGAVVALAPREPDQPLNEQALWYTAAGPERRRDPQEIRLAWRWRVGENQTHRWDTAQWLWDPNSAAEEAERWGISDLPVTMLGLPSSELPALPDTASHTERVAQTIRLQDAGRLQEALALWDIDCCEMVQNLLDGQEERWQCDHAPAVQTAVRKAALWRLPVVVAAENTRLEHWRKEKPGRPRKYAYNKLFSLPHETAASRACLFLGAGPKGIGVRLFVENTAWNARLPEALWQRPLDLDLRRFGMEA